MVVGLLLAVFLLGIATPVSAGSFTKYATIAAGEGFTSPINAVGPPDGARSEGWMGSEGYLWGGGFATESGYITKVVIGVIYRVDIPAVDDTVTLKYSLDGGATFGSTKLTWVPGDTAWVEKTLDITSDTSVNGGSWDWNDISNLKIFVQNTVVGPYSRENEDEWFLNIDDTTVMVDAFFVTVITSETPTTTPTTSPPPPPPPSFDFSISASLSDLTVQRSGSVSTELNVNLVFGIPQTVLLSGVWVGTPPEGVFPSLSPPSGTPSFSSTLTFSTTPEATVGSFTYQVKGISGSTVRTTNVSITVTELAPPAAPMLLSPDDGVVLDTVTPTFEWADVVASSYNLEIATDREFTHVILTKITMEPTATLSQHEALSYGTIYYWRVRGVNAAGVGEWSAARSFIAKVAAPKVLGLQIGEGTRYVNTADVQLSINAVNAVQISLSTDGITWSEWEEFRPTMLVELQPPDGPKSIYVRVRDAAGDVGQSVSASVILDRTPPDTKHFISGDVEKDGYLGAVVVNLVAEDLTSGVSETKYRIDNGGWNAGDVFVIVQEGKHRVEYYSTDRAGNIEPTRSFEIIIYTPEAPLPVILQYWWAVLGTASAVAVVAILVHRRLRIASRLKQIRKEKAELPRLKRQAEIKYFKEGTISRQAYEKLIEEYERRRAELEKEEKLLLERLKKRRGKKG